MGNSQILEIATANNVSLKQKTDQQQQEKCLALVRFFFLSFSLLFIMYKTIFLAFFIRDR
jgi:hypothetical protein